MKLCRTFALQVSCVYLIKDEITTNYKLIIHANYVYSDSHCKGSSLNFTFNIRIFKQINQFLFPLQSSVFSDDFKANKN